MLYDWQKFLSLEALKVIRLNLEAKAKTKENNHCITKR